jgi:hypothetical protein
VGEGCVKVSPSTAFAAVKRLEKAIRIAIAFNNWQTVKPFGQIEKKFERVDWQIKKQQFYNLLSILTTF